MTQKSPHRRLNTGTLITFYSLDDYQRTHVRQHDQRRILDLRCTLLEWNALGSFSGDPPRAVTMGEEIYVSWTSYILYTVVGGADGRDRNIVYWTSIASIKFVVHRFLLCLVYSTGIIMLTVPIRAQLKIDNVVSNTAWLAKSSGIRKS